MLFPIVQKLTCLTSGPSACRQGTGYTGIVYLPITYRARTQNTVLRKKDRVFSIK